MICVAEITVTFVAGPLPKLTAAPVAKLVPVIVTVAPPPVEPTFGLTELMLGAGRYV